MKIKSLCFKNEKTWITFCAYCGRTRSLNQTPLMNFWNQLGFYDPKAAGNYALYDLLTHIEAEHHDERIQPSGEVGDRRVEEYLHYQRIMLINQEYQEYGHPSKELASMNEDVQDLKQVKSSEKDSDGVRWDYGQKKMDRVQP